MRTLSWLFHNTFGHYQQNSSRRSREFEKHDHAIVSSLKWCSRNSIFANYGFSWNNERSANTSNKHRLSSFRIVQQASPSPMREVQRAGAQRGNYLEHIAFPIEPVQLKEQNWRTHRNLTVTPCNHIYPHYKRFKHTHSMNVQWNIEIHTR